jgi:hypothetical protein
MTTQRNHAFRERQSLVLNSAIAERLRASTQDVIERARGTLARWKGMAGLWRVDLGKWEEILVTGDPGAIHWDPYGARRDVDTTSPVFAIFGAA